METIRSEDVTENATIQFSGANILRQPIIKAKSREANKFSAKQVEGRGDTIELRFLYLDHNDGAVVEVLHTGTQTIACSGNIMGVDKIGGIGEFSKLSTKAFGAVRFTIVLDLLSGVTLAWMFVAGFFRDFPWLAWLFGGFLCASLALLVPGFLV